MLPHSLMCVYPFPSLSANLLLILLRSLKPSSGGRPALWHASSHMPVLASRCPERLRTSFQALEVLLARYRPYASHRRSSKFAGSAADLQEPLPSYNDVLGSLGELVCMQNSKSERSHTDIVISFHHCSPAKSAYVPEFRAESTLRVGSPFASSLEFYSDQDMCGHLLCKLYNPIYSKINERQAPEIWRESTK